MEDVKPIRVNVIYGEESRSDALRAYKAESELKRAVAQNKKKIEDFFLEKHCIFPVYTFKKLESNEKEDFSLIDIINSKLTNSSIVVTLDAYDVYKRCGIELAIERIHLQSNLTNI